MSSRTRTMRDAAAKWGAVKLITVGLAVGLVAGPVLSGPTGFQVRTSTAQSAARAGVVEQQAMFCAERARAASAGTALLGWRERTDLARRWASMPGSAIVDPDVVLACAGKLPA